MEIINKTNFEEKVLRSDKKVVVDFFATWCGPCKMLSPILDELDNEYNGNIVFYKVDIDKDIDIAQKYKIMSVPAVYIFKDGNVVNKSIGLVDKNTLKAAIDS